MSQQDPNKHEYDPALDAYTSMDNDDPIPNDDLTTIHKKESINPAKRRRLEAMREEKELEKGLRDIFDDADWPD